MNRPARPLRDGVDSPSAEGGRIRLGVKDMVRCASCGYLSHKNRETGTLDQVDEDTRKSGMISPPLEMARQGHLPTPLMPVCFANAWPLAEEVTKCIIEQPGKPKVVLVIERDRKCGSFTDWIKGFTPKQHSEIMYDLEKLRLEMRMRREDRIALFIAALIGAGATLLGVFISK